jgi:hypothetical protein
MAPAGRRVTPESKEAERRINQMLSLPEDRERLPDVWLHKFGLDEHNKANVPHWAKEIWHKYKRENETPHMPCRAHCDENTCGPSSQLGEETSKPDCSHCCWACPGVTEDQLRESKNARSAKAAIDGKGLEHNAPFVCPYHCGIDKLAQCTGTCMDKTHKAVCHSGTR